MRSPKQTPRQRGPQLAPSWVLGAGRGAGAVRVLIWAAASKAPIPGPTVPRSEVVVAGPATYWPRCVDRSAWKIDGLLWFRPKVRSMRLQLQEARCRKCRMLCATGSAETGPFELRAGAMKRQSCPSQTIDLLSEEPSTSQKQP